MSDKIRKYVLPNLPYLFVFWFFSKIGTAYRIAPGTDFGTKLMGMLDTFPKAFETYWPGLGGIYNKYFPSPLDIRDAISQSKPSNAIIPKLSITFIICS